ncbi:MAG TPA: DUF3592 domain-containing protein [Anaeromyxobacter sp.]|nr:DUF3592 domain-containing protein [Anaeromyxobacter sp.]
MAVPGFTAGRAPSRRAIAIIGGLVLLVGAYQGVAALRLVARTEPATGVVVARGGSTYTVRFEVEGRSVQFQAPLPTTRGFARRWIQVGGEVPVRYDPDAPGEASVAGSALWIFPAALLFIGAAALSSLLVDPRRGKLRGPPSGA